MVRELIDARVEVIVAIGGKGLEALLNVLIKIKQRSKGFMKKVC